MKRRFFRHRITGHVVVLWHQFHADRAALWDALHRQWVTVPDGIAEADLVAIPEQRRQRAAAMAFGRDD